MTRQMLAVLSDGKPHSLREVVAETGLTDGAAGNALRRLWEAGRLLRTSRPIYEPETLFKGRAGLRKNLRPYHLYLLRLGRESSKSGEGREFVRFSQRYLDPRGGGARSKASLVIKFLKDRSKQGWYSKEIANQLSRHGVKIGDVMGNLRRYEAEGKVLVRGYRTDDRQTPFKDGFLVTWIDQERPRDAAISEALERTNKRLEHTEATNPLMGRVHRIRDLVLQASREREIVSQAFLLNELGCSEYEFEGALTRALQLYSDLRQVKLFDRFRYFYHTEISDPDLQAAVAMKKNYLRLTKGRANRIGHNWEACVEWFIDRSTTGAKFWSQNHRTNGMDPRRITVHLMRSVGDRKQNAELDRVWEVSPGPLLDPTTYVLECKWGLVSKRDVDDFFRVLQWSKEFGVNTPDGRQVRQGVKGVFAGSAFNPKENVRLKDDQVITLPEYAGRMNIQLLKSADLNQKLRERAVPKHITLQELCRVAKDEGQTRTVLTSIWENPKLASELLARTTSDNEGIYNFEKSLKA